MRIVDLRSTISSPERHAINCFECATSNDTVPAVGVCQHCGVGLCLDHLVEAREFRVGGTLYACSHALPSVKPLRSVPAGIAAAARHTTEVS